MKVVWLILFLVFIINTQAEPLKFKGKIGFVNSEDKFTLYKFVEDGKKAVFIGQNNIQIWDVELLKPLNNLKYSPTKYERLDLMTKIVNFGNGLKWETLEIDPKGRWFIAFEGFGKNKSAVIRDLYNGKQLAKLQLSSEIEALSVNDGDITVVSKKVKGSENSLIGIWDGESFQHKGIISLDNYKWHKQLIDKNKVLVGFGQVKWNEKGCFNCSKRIAVVDLKTNTIEKEFQAQKYLGNEIYFNPIISDDGKYLIAKTVNQIVVWELLGNGKPILENYLGSSESVVTLQKLLDQKTLSIMSVNNNSIEVLTNYSNIALKPLDESIGEEIKTRRFIDNHRYLGVSKSSKITKLSHTEFYDTKTKNLEFTVPFELGSKTFFTKNRKFLITERIGSFEIWNFDKQTAYQISLKFSKDYCDESDTLSYLCPDTYTQEEFLQLSFDEEYIIKYSSGQSVVIKLETGKEVQNIFNAERVKYDKKNKVKNSGIANIELLGNRYFVISNGNRNEPSTSIEGLKYCANCESLSLWEQSK